MPQYPIPPWREDQPPAQRRRMRLRSDNPRYAHLPLVKADLDGTITVLRGAANLANELVPLPETQELREARNVDRPHFVVRNRLGRLVFMPTDRPVWAGQLEFYLYSAPYEPPQTVSSAGSIEQLREALQDEIARLGALRADGWDLVAVRTGQERWVQLLVDTRRPDEVLDPRELP